MGNEEDESEPDDAYIYIPDLMTVGNAVVVAVRLSLHLHFFSSFLRISFSFFVLFSLFGDASLSGAFLLHDRRGSLLGIGVLGHGEV